MKLTTRWSTLNYQDWHKRGAPSAGRQVILLITTCSLRSLGVATPDMLKIAMTETSLQLINKLVYILSHERLE